MINEMAAKKFEIFYIFARQERVFAPKSGSVQSGFIDPGSIVLHYIRNPNDGVHSILPLGP